ncbi:MAG TPA: Uma2 family endonuclease [Blastocatellia bacterium]|nr:Uma2 family endonuclease [Blastocatellia bacterium]
MAAILDETETPTAVKPAESRVLLHNVSWATYESLLEDLADCSAPRLTYDRGDLEIMSPQAKHEGVNETIKLLIGVVSEELDIEIQGLGSTTFKREDAERGFEADSCFYIQNAALVRGKDRLDLPADPPPEIVFEVDITGSSLDKDSIFAQLGVFEVWRYDGRRMQILISSGEGYQESQASSALPFITAEILENFVSGGRTLSRPEWFKKVRAWVKQQRISS